MGAPFNKRSIAIFDWDDTLFATTAFMPKEEKDVDNILKNYRDVVKQLDTKVVSYSLLNLTNFVL